MATKEWRSHDGDLNNNANYSDGSPPAASGDKMWFLETTKDITQNLNWSGKTFVQLLFGDGIIAKIGTPGAPLIIGGATEIRVNSPKTPGIALKIDDGSGTGNVADFLVEDVNTGPYALHLASNAAAGDNIDNLQIQKAGGLTLSTIDITNINIAGVPRATNVFIQSGAIIANLISVNANIITEAVMTTLLKAVRSRVEWRGSSLTMPLLELYNAVFVWNAKGSTLSQFKNFGGQIDGTSREAKTVTNGEVWDGGTVNFDNGQNNLTVSNPIKNYGGYIFGTTSIDEIFAPFFPGGSGASL
ncbi:hypothetical protein C4588_07190 [Candidatus Parcubacteria bacterium]|nr:MAG: hypothetical protein C4588_07190 [Candidatus Parcubacteria bacterium]